VAVESSGRRMIGQRVEGEGAVEKL